MCQVFHAMAVEQLLEAPFPPYGLCRYQMVYYFVCTEKMALYSSSFLLVRVSLETPLGRAGA
jgi:hypothetical protein